jgi:hypothetical protein
LRHGIGRHCDKFEIPFNPFVLFRYLPNAIGRNQLSSILKFALIYSMQNSKILITGGRIFTAGHDRQLDVEGTVAGREKS